MYAVLFLAEMCYAYPLCTVVAFTPKKYHYFPHSMKSWWDMASCSPSDCHAETEGVVSQHVEEETSSFEHHNGCFSGFSGGRLCNRFGSFPAYYRGRRDFRAACRNEGVSTSEFKDLRDAVFKFVEGHCPSDSRGGSLDLESSALLIERWQDVSGNRREGPPVECRSVYDLDWRLGSIADFSKAIFAGKDVLDLGCNTGKISFLVASLMQARRVMGVDVDATLISKARTEMANLQRAHGLRIDGKCPARFSQHRNSIFRVEDNKGALSCVDVLSAEPRNEEGASLSAPSTDTLVKRRMLRGQFQYISSSVDARHTAPPHSQECLRCCRSIRSKSGDEGSRFGETPLIQSTRVNVSTYSGTTSGESPSERIQSPTGPRVARVLASTVGLPSAEVTSCQFGKLVEREGARRRYLTGRVDVLLPASPDIAPRKRVCAKASVPPFDSTLPDGRAGGRNVGDAHGEGGQYAARFSKCSTTQWKFLSNRSGSAVSGGKFPYNISFCVADALAGEPWRLPTICGDACSPGSSSASCFCGLIGEIREQQKQLGSETTELQERVIKLDRCGGTSSRCQQEYVQTSGRPMGEPFEWKRFEEAFDVVICFSLTKWIHLRHGDKGILLLFARLHALLKTGGLLLLEPQDWASYRRARRICALFKTQLKSIRLCPRMFCSILTRNRACSCSGELVILKGAPSRSKTCGVLAEDFSERQHRYAGTRKTADPHIFSCPSHGRPFSLLAMLHPWSDLEKALSLVNDKVKHGNSPSTSSKEVCTARQDEIQHMQHPRIPERGGVRFSVQDPSAAINEWKGGKSRLEEPSADKNIVRISHKNSHGNDTLSGEFGVEVGTKVMPLRQESVLSPPRVLQCRRRTVLKEGEPEADDRDFPVSSVVFKRRNAVLTNECNGDQRRKASLNDDLAGEPIHGATQESCDWHWETSPSNVCEDREIQASASSVHSQEAGTPGGNDATRVKRPATTVSEGCLFETRKTRIGEVKKNRESTLLRHPGIREEGESRQKMQPSQEKRSLKSRGTLADRFVYVLQKVSSDFTLCCRQLQECAHAKAACMNMVGTGARDNVIRSQCVGPDPES